MAETINEEEIFRQGMNLINENQLQGALDLFSKYRNCTPLMSSGYSFVAFMLAVMSFDEILLKRAVEELKLTAKKCSRNKDFERKIPLDQSALLNEDRIRRDIIISDCRLYLAVLNFIQQDVSGYVKGGWLLRKAWRLCERRHRELFDQLSPSDKTEYGGAPSYMPLPPESQQDVAIDDDEKDDDEEVPEAIAGTMDRTTSRKLLASACFGYGLFQLCISFMPPSILKLMQILGFEGDRESGLAALRYGSGSDDGKATLCQLTLLWYFTLIRPFFSLDGASEPADLNEAEAVLRKPLELHPKSSLLLFFRARVARLRGDVAQALFIYQEALEAAKGVNELESLGYMEIGWGELCNLNYAVTMDCFQKLKEKSRWSQCFYAYVIAVCLGSTGNQAQCAEIFKQLPKLVKKKSNPIEMFVFRRAEKFKKTGLDTTRCQLLAVEMLYFWNCFPNCNAEQLNKVLDVLSQQIDKRVMAVSSLMEGVIRMQQGDEEYAVQLLKEAIARSEDSKEDRYVHPYALFELAVNDYRRGNLALAKEQLTRVRDKFKDYDMENRLEVRVHHALALLSKGAGAK